MPQPYTDPNSYASDPGGVTASEAKLRALHPEIYEPPPFWLKIARTVARKGPEDALARLSHYMTNGDSRAAVVIQTSPLLVAAYTDELDCVAMLEFPQVLVKQYKLELGSELLTVNIYWGGLKIARDLTAGPENTGRYANFQPTIADFMSDDLKRIARRKREISRAEWDRTIDLGMTYVEQNPGVARDGRPLRSGDPA